MIPFGEGEYQSMVEDARKKLSIKDDGGSAFPSHGTMGEVVHEGMSLRQYAIIQFIAALLASPPTSYGFHGHASRVRFAEAQADAMIEDGKK